MEEKKKVEVLELVSPQNEEKMTIVDNSELKRDDKGRFVKGTVPCRSGGRKPIPPEIKQLFTSMVPEVVSKIHEIILTSDDNKLVLDAAKIVLDRVYGKPLQAVDVDAKTDTTIKIVLDGDAKEWSK